MRNLIIICVFFMFSSCISERKLIINELCKEIETPLNGRSSDTLTIIDKNFVIYDNFFNNYLKAEQISNKHKIDGDFYWDRKYRWDLNIEDVNYFEKTILNQNIIKFKKRHFKGKMNLVSSDSIERNISVIVDEKAINTGKYTYCISEPIFNKKKDLAIISLKTIIPSIHQFQNNKTIIFKKKNNHWFKICVIKSTME